MHKIISTSVVKLLLLDTCYITMNSLNFNIKSKWQINRAARKQKKHVTLCYKNSWWVGKMIISVVSTVLHGSTVYRTPRGVALDFEPKYLAYYNNTKGNTPARFACQSPPSKSAYGLVPPPTASKPSPSRHLKYCIKKESVF